MNSLANSDERTKSFIGKIMNIEAIKESIETLRSLSANRDPQTNEELDLAFRLDGKDVKKNLITTIGFLELLIDNYLEKIKIKPINAGKKWEEEEDNALAAQFDYSKNRLGENLEDIIYKLSESHRRSERGIAYRLKLLGKIDEVPFEYTVNNYDNVNTEFNKSEVKINKTEIKNSKKPDSSLNAITISTSDFQTHIQSLLTDIQSKVDEGPGLYYEMSPNNWHQLHSHFFDKEKIKSARKELQYSMIAWLDSQKLVNDEIENIVIDELKREIYKNDSALIQVSEIALLAKSSETLTKLRECYSQF